MAVASSRTDAEHRPDPAAMPPRRTARRSNADAGDLDANADDDRPIGGSSSGGPRASASAATAGSALPIIASTPFWVEVWTARCIDVDGRKHRPSEEDLVPIREARRAQDIALRNPCPDTIEIDGWAVGESFSTEFGVCAENDGHASSGKLDLRWLENRPLVPRCLGLVNVLILLCRQANFEQVWSEGEVVPSRSSMLQHPTVRRLLALTRHPRINLIAGSADRRLDFTRQRWRAELVLHMACQWCGLPSQNQCQGQLMFACRRALCTACEPVFVRCPRCWPSIGTPPVWPNPPTNASTVLPHPVERQWYTQHIQPMLSEEWSRIWDGVTELPDPALA